MFLTMKTKEKINLIDYTQTIIDELGISEGDIVNSTRTVGAKLERLKTNFKKFNVKEQNQKELNKIINAAHSCLSNFSGNMLFNRTQASALVNNLKNSISEMEVSDIIKSPWR